MPAFFAHQRGSVSMVVPGPKPGGIIPFAIRMNEMDIGGKVNPQTRAIITQAGIVENGNFQFLHTLQETIYVYVFGDRIGELRVTGICFSVPCFNNGEHENGIQQIIRNYRRSRLGRTGHPVLVNFGETVYRGFLTGMNVEVVDPERNLGQWSLRFHTFPGEK